MGFCGKEEREYGASNRVVCGSRHVSLYEMKKREQIYEDARKMYRAKILDKKFGKMVKTAFGVP